MSCKLSIGMMSGTSVDGAVDTAAIITDGDSYVERKLVSSHRYETPEGSRPVHHFTKAAEITYRHARGDHAAAAALYPGALEIYAKETFGISEPDAIALKIKTLSADFFGGEDRPVTLDDVIERSTEVHAEAAEKIMQELGAEARAVALIGYHGQTLYHAPFDHITVQVGNAQALANRLRIPVVFDFRGADIKKGGQGAPLAPVYHRALLRQAGLSSAAILNLGGTANVTIVSSKTDAIIGFDTGPANGLIDKYVKEKIGTNMDEDSKLALQGTVSEKALRILMNKGICLADGRNYLEIPPPKSLDIRDYTYNFPEFNDLTVEDGCATLNAFSAECIARGLDWLKQDGQIEMPEHWILCGGGAHSPNLRREITQRVEAKLGKTVTLISADQAGWSAQGMEAELFAFLAVRSERGLPLTFPKTTGVSEPLTGGQIFYPS